MKYSGLYIMALAAFASISCNKDDEPMARQKTKTELLTAGTWRVSSYTVNPPADVTGDGVKESDVYAAMQSCEKDNRTTFYLSGAGQIDEGPTKCDPSDEQITLISWTFNQNESAITVDGILYQLMALTETEMRVTQQEVVGNDTYTHSITFVH